MKNKKVLGAGILLLAIVSFGRAAYLHNVEDASASSVWSILAGVVLMILALVLGRKKQ
jgi:LPXTG-motif cell wall-anchored protein